MKNDLDARIRAKLAEFESSAEYGNEGILDMLIRVTRTMLDQHQPVPDVELNGVVNCSECTEEYSNGHVQAEYPCDTIKDIAESLGVEIE